MLQHRDSALIIFVKNLVHGKVKTRLAQTVGHDRAMEIYKSMVERIARVTVGFSGTRYVYFSDFIGETVYWNTPGTQFEVQSSGDIGTRMYNALRDALTTHDKAVLVGTDIPQLGMTEIEGAFSILDRHDLALGPTEDGGYYLIGLKRPQRSLFEDVKWSTAEVIDQTLMRATEAGLSHAFAATLGDVDYAEDWERLGWSL